MTKDKGKPDDYEVGYWLCCTNQVVDGVPLSPGQTYPTTSVTGMPSAVKPLRMATRTWNSAT